MKLVRENINYFKRGQNPRKSLGIGLNKSLMNTKSWKVLEFIESKESDGGATLTEIQEFIYFELNGAPKGKDWFYKKDEFGQRVSRGYWTTQLYSWSGYGYGFRRYDYGYERKGIFGYCEKRNGKWFLKKYPREGERFTEKRTYESFPDFKRGQKPSESLGIGFERYSKAWREDVEWYDEKEGVEDGEKGEEILLELFRQHVPELEIYRLLGKDEMHGFRIFYFYWITPKGRITIQSTAQGNIKLAGMHENIIFGNIVFDAGKVLDKFADFYDSMQKLSESNSS